MSVSVVIQSHHQRYLALRARTSAEEQTNRPFEIAIIESEIVGDSLPAKRNYGARGAMTNLLVFLSADDLLHPCFLERTLPAIEDADAVYTDVQMFGDEWRRLDTPDTFPTGDLLTNNRYPGTLLIRRETFEEIGGYDEDDGMWCDWGLWLKLARARKKAVRVPEPLTLYRRHADCASIKRTPEEDAALRRHIAEKYA